MIKFILVALGLILALEKVPPAQAQVTLDVSKITCDQYNAYKVTNPQNIAIWVNGYYHGKRGDVTLDTQRLVESARKLRDYCRRNRQTLVLEAVETLFEKRDRQFAHPTIFQRWFECRLRRRSQR
jgi:acid stress chaperone HdeB